jgi:cold shock CspA family protein
MTTPVQQQPIVEEACRSKRDIGCVKWFNNKAGYGFLSVSSEGTSEPRDVFVHHSAIKVGQEQYRYLVQGEYVEFEFATVTTEGHKYQAANVSGVRGGKLMCETRNENRVPKTEQATRPPRVNTEKTHRTMPSSDKKVVVDNDGVEWIPVRRKQPQAEGQTKSQPSSTKKPFTKR